MHIGIDGGCWNNRRGYGRFLRELAEALARVDGAHRYTVFLDSESYPTFSLKSPFAPYLVETREAVGKAAVAGARRSMADLLRMSRAVSGQPLDLFFFPSVYSYFPVFSSVPVVMGIHDTIADRNPRFAFASRRQHFFWQCKVRAAIGQASTILTVSEYSKDCLHRWLRIPASRIRVMYEAASPRFRPSPRACEREPLVLYAGGISPNKNLPTLIRAFAGARARERARLVLVGDYQSDGFKSCYAELVALIEELDLAGRVTFTGFIPDEALCDLYNRAAVFAMPSFDEGFGLPAMEAMACGLPVVVSTGNAMEEIVGDAGLRVPPLDVEGWSAAIDRVLVHRDLAADLSGRALARASEFSWDRAAGQLLSVFEDAAGRKRA